MSSLAVFFCSVFFLLFFSVLFSLFLTYSVLSYSVLFCSVLLFRHFYSVLLYSFHRRHARISCSVLSFFYLLFFTCSVLSCSLLMLFTLVLICLLLLLVSSGKIFDRRFANGVSHARQDVPLIFRHHWQQLRSVDKINFDNTLIVANSWLCV